LSIGNIDDTTKYDVTPHVATTVAGVKGVYKLSILSDITKFEAIGPYVNNPSVTTVCGTKALMSNLGDVSIDTPAVTKC